jgi:hypothetical protein
MALRISSPKLHTIRLDERILLTKSCIGYVQAVLFALCVVAVGVGVTVGVMGATLTK